MTDLREAAILISSLDDRTATRLLVQLDPAARSTLREAAVALGEVEQQERDRVLQQFLQAKTNPSGSITNDSPEAKETQSSTIENSSNPSTSQTASSQASNAKEFSTEQDPVRESIPVSSSTDHQQETRFFDFLRDADLESLQEFLEDEHPQTISLVMTYLPPQRASELLALLQGALQMEVIHRLMESESSE